MNWLMPAGVASLTGTLLLSLVYFYLYTQDRHRYLAIWSASWALYSIRFCFLILAFLFGRNIVFDLGYYEFNLVGGPLLIWGVSMFLNRAMSKVWLLSTFLFALWIPIAIWGNFSFISQTFPTFTFLAIIYIWTGIAFLRSQNIQGLGKYFVGWTFIIWGIHKGDYPLLRQVTWFAPWGYSFGESFAVMAAIGMLLIYFEKTKAELLINQDKLKESERFIHNILETVDEGFIIVDRDMKILSANRAYLKTLGMTIDNVVGRHCYELTHHINNPCYSVGEDCSVRHAFETGKPHSCLHIHHNNVHGHIYAETKAYPLFDSSGNIVSAIETISDITEKKALEEQLRQAQKMESVGTLAAGVAHDFNNILSAITGYGHLTLMKMAKDEPLRLNIENILQAADRAAHLTKDLLLLGRKQVTDRKPVDLNEVIRKVVKFLLRVIGEDIEFKTMLHDKPLVVLADSHQIEQVLMNFAANARDAMPTGGSFTITTQKVILDDQFITAHGYGRLGTYVLVTVTDSGKGMVEETRRRVFEPFFTTKEVGKGTGLGLAVVYGIIKQHEGYINVYSKPGKGTAFRIYLPELMSGVSEDEKVSSEDQSSQGTETILLAEDHESVRNLTRDVLEEFGYTVITAVDGEDAICKFIENRDKIQLLLFDLIMPKKTGKEAYEEIRKIKSDIKIIFCSGYAPDIIRQRAQVDDRLTIAFKPLSPLDLLKKVRSVLDEGES